MGLGPFDEMEPPGSAGGGTVLADGPAAVAAATCEAVSAEAYEYAETGGFQPVGGDAAGVVVAAVAVDDPAGFADADYAVLLEAGEDGLLVRA
jgi:hypothetical protein